MDLMRYWTSCHCKVMVLLCIANLLLSAENCLEDCKCTAWTVSCVKKNLTEIPTWIRSSTRVLDLSENPLLKLNESSLVRFKWLESLSLGYCDLHQSFEIPKSVRDIDLRYNLLSLANIANMFNRKDSRIASINLRGNKIKLDGNFSVFPKLIKVLRLDENSLEKIRSDDLKELINLSVLSLGKTGINSICEGAFDHLSELRKLLLFGNNIKSLPRKIFQFNRKIFWIDLEDNNLAQVPDFRGIRHLTYLYLARNRIKTVEGYNLGVHQISFLYLASNEIESFNLTGIKYLSLDLSRNRIMKIRRQSFGNNLRISALLLQGNKLTSLAKDSFEGLNDISELHLQRNHLQRIERGVFRDMNIEKLLLFSNNLDSIDGILEGMKRRPHLLLLFGNPDVRNVRSSDFENMTVDSEIYISCNTLMEFSSPFNLKAKLICSPSTALKVTAVTAGLEGNGFYCDGLSPYTCYPCKPGEYDAAKSGGTSGCHPCPYGAFYQDQMASINCKSCPLGQYVPPDNGPGKSPLDCLTCPKGTNTNASAGYRACHCLPGYSRRYRFGSCKRCTLVGFKCERDYPELRPGYWMSWVKVEMCRTSLESFMSNLDTTNDSYSRETSHFACNLPIAHKCPIDGSCQGGVDASCNIGYTGVLCSVCDKGHMMSYNRCVKCPSPFVSVIECISYFLLFVILCLLMSKLDTVSLAGRKDPNDERTFADLIQSSLKILMGFYQLLVRIINAFSSIQWPTTLTHAMSALEFVQFSVLRIPALHCIRSNWRLDAVKEFWISLIAMATVPCLILIYFSINATVAYCRFSQESLIRRRWLQSFKNCLQSIVLFFFAIYPFISTNIFHVLPGSCHTFCTAKENGKCLHEMSYLRNDYSVKCPGTNSASHFSVAYAYISLLLPIGLPFILLYLLWRFAPKDDKPAEQRYRGIQSESLLGNEGEGYLNWEATNVPLLYSETAKSHVAPVVAVALKMTYGNYKTSCWYWEFIEMIRKLVTIIASSFLLQNVKIGLYSNILLSLVFVVVHAKIWPMKDSFDNYMQLLALISVTVNLCYSVTKTSSIGDADIIENKRDIFALGLMLVTLNSLLVVLILGRFVKEIAMKIVQKLGNCGCSCCCSTQCCHVAGGTSHNEQLVL